VRSSVSGSLELDVALRWRTSSSEIGRTRGVLEAQTDFRVDGAGEFVIPTATSPGGEALRKGRLSRRGFMIAAGAASITVLAGCGGGDAFTPFSPAVDTGKAWMLSTRNVSGASNAAKAHGASKRFVSAAAADAGRAHPGDNSRVVSVDIAEATWTTWFGGGLDGVDLRQL
jgi:hypothetical protein